MKSIQKVVLLDVIHRQSDDQMEFKIALNNLSCGKSTQQDWSLFMQRRYQMVRDDPSFANAIYLFSQNDQVTEMNNRKLSQNGQPVALIQAENNNATARRARDTMAQGLANLSSGCQIMLRKNLFVDRGLVNGSLGTVRQIIYAVGVRPPDLPLVILAEFDRFEGPFFRDRTFPILPTTANWREREAQTALAANSR